MKKGEIEERVCQQQQRLSNFSNLVRAQKTSSQRAPARSTEPPCGGFGRSEFPGCQLPVSLPVRRRSVPLILATHVSSASTHTFSPYVALAPEDRKVCVTAEQDPTSVATPSVCLSGSLDKQLHHVQEGDVRGVEKSLHLGACVHGLDVRKPLHVAARFGRADIITVLGVRGADLEATPGEVRDGDRRFVFSKGSRAVHAAVYAGMVAAVRALIGAGANPDATGHTPLMQACRSSVREKERIAIVRELLRAGADPALEIDDGMVALHFAALRDAADVIELLVQRQPTTLNLQRVRRDAPVLRRFWRVREGGVVSDFARCERPSSVVGEGCECSRRGGARRARGRGWHPSRRSRRRRRGGRRRDF